MQVLSVVCYSIIIPYSAMDHLGYVAMIAFQVTVMMVSSVLSQANNSQGISICNYYNSVVITVTVHYSGPIGKSTYQLQL